MLDVILQVDHGRLRSARGASLTTITPGKQIELTGTLTQINRELASLVYGADLGYVGPDTLYVEVVDPGNPAADLTMLTAYQTVQLTVI
jgi:hypothetical protein